MLEQNVTEKKLYTSFYWATGLGSDINTMIVSYPKPIKGYEDINAITEIISDAFYIKGAFIKLLHWNRLEA